MDKRIFFSGFGIICLEVLIGAAYLISTLGLSVLEILIIRVAILNLIAVVFMIWGALRK